MLSYALLDLPPPLTPAHHALCANQGSNLRQGHAGASLLAEKLCG